MLERTEVAETINVETHKSRHYLVGIGASAGGLEALTQLISALPSNLGISYIIIQHLSPTHRSMMAQLLGRETPMVVCEIEDGTLPEPDIIYIAPAGRNTILLDGRLKLLEPKRENMPKPSVNAFFASMAEEKTEDAIGIILSGTGSDGTLGVRNIKANGGLTFAQEVSSAKYNGMPQSAIDSGCVDWILTPDKIAAEITAIVQNQPTPIPVSELLKPTTVANQLKRLLLNIKQKNRIDFSGYKEATLWRRIERRMTANHILKFPDYFEFTNENPEELDYLSKDILISVTAFFRDAEAFDQIRQVIKSVVSNKQVGEEIRFWVPACATGEEAYTIAILLAEELGSKMPLYKIQIFATDIDNDAMNFARKGVYVEGALADVEPAYITKYFTGLHGRYEIVKSIRDLLVFARQDLIQDPSFLRLDLISCRNVLIYLKADIQHKIISTFYYGLRDGGYLFLGKSEGIFEQVELFDTVDKTYKIYRRHSTKELLSLAPAQLSKTEQNIRKLASVKTLAENKLVEALLRNYAPASVLVNKSLDIQHILGDVSDFLSISAGKPTTNLMQLICRELKPDLQLLHHQAEKKQETVIGKKHLIKCGTNKRCIRLAIHPTETKVNTPYFMVCFEDVSAESENKKISKTNSSANDSSQNVRAIEDELIMTRERLQTVIEELETSNEELQALNEEVQSANEELQSSNEELESTNEELQSTNEELTTVNDELQIRTNELAEALNDLENIQNSVGFPILAVSDQFKIMRFNAPAAALFSLTPAMVGLPFPALRLPAGMTNFTAQLQKALTSKAIVEAAISSQERHYLLHISPYQTTHKDISGAIVTLVDDTERRAIAEETLTNHEKLLSIMNNSTAIITLKDIAGRYEFVNHQFEEIFNLKAEDILGKTDRQFLSEQIADDFRAKELEVVRKLKTIESEDHIKHGDLDLYFLSVRFPLVGADNLPYGICTQSSDITTRIQAESQLRLASRVFDRSSEGIIVTDNRKRILTVNEAFTTITGYKFEEVRGKNPKFLSSGLHDAPFYRELWDSVKTKGYWQGEILNRRKNGEVYPEWQTINAIHDHKGNISNFVAMFSDITIVKQSQQRIEFLASHDPLTELPNRLLFLDRVNHAIERGDRGSYPFGILFIDLDDFKVVNDSLGHSTGDNLLKEVAIVMKHLVRPVDTVARFGGDEFVLLIENTTIEEIEATAKRICSTMSNTQFLGSQAVHVGASCGIAVYPDDGANTELLLKHADTAMYEAKLKGKNLYQFFTKNMMEQVDNRLRLENGLRLALENGQLNLHFQPQIDIVSGQLIGAEALVRWCPSENRVIGPAEFIHLAEKCGLIDKLGEWVVDTAFAQMKSWLLKGYHLPQLSINISLEQFRRGQLVDTMKRLLNLYDLQGQSIRLEITESTLAESYTGLLESLQKLKSLGIKISIDDFGTGYSSLARLKIYPIDELKIDRSFVDGITEPGQDQSIAQTIIDLGKTMGLNVVAEGVETDDQMDILKKMGCNIAQGFLISKPLKAEDFIHKFGSKIKVSI